MRAGHPLTDEDRWPWLARVAQWVDDRLAAHEPGIITCSDLKRAYRKITIGDREGALLVYLRADEPLIAAQLAQRKHRYMPESLLHSQFETLEEPTPDEHPIVVPIAGSVRDTAIDLLRKIAAVQARERRPDRVSPVTCESTARSA
jgi:carbohydrate kinase (thermoresistant glucokinase family)